MFFLLNFSYSWWIKEKFSPREQADPQENLFTAEGVKQLTYQLFHVYAVTLVKKSYLSVEIS